MELLTPKEAAVVLKLSTATITRCRKRGAPVHAWGSTGRSYRINIPEFVAWMEAQGKVEEQPKMGASLKVMDMAEARRAHVRALGKGGLNHAAV